MPLIKGKSAKVMDKSDASKPALAIAYSVKRKKKMESGGSVKKDMSEHMGSESKKPMMGFESGGMVKRDMAEHMGDEAEGPMEGRSRYYDGGEVHADECSCARCLGDMPGALSAKEAEMRSREDADRDMMFDGGMAGEPETKPMMGSIADKILGKHRSAVDDNSVEEPGDRQHTPYFKDDEEAVDHDFDSTMDGMEQPEDSNEDSRKLSDADSHDMVSELRKKYSIKKR